jgi:drug/metabolite transporter (DMT)-like permease
MHSPSGNNLLGFLLSLNTAMLWGILPIALKEVILTMDAYTIVWYRFLAAALVIGPYLYARKRLPAPEFSRFGLLLLLVAALGLCGNYLLFALSLNYLNAESTEVVVQLTTLFLLLGGVIIFREPFVLLQKLGAVAIVVGLALFFNDRLVELFAASSQMKLGILLVVLSALSWVVYALLQKHLLQQFSSVQILLVVYVISALLLTPLAAPTSVQQLSQLQLWLLAFCCLNTILAYGSFAEALAHWHASKVSAVLALAPLFTIVGLKVIVWINPAYTYTDHLNPLSIIAAVILVLGSMTVALVPLWQARRKIKGVGVV